jgi:PST family polysaccharide transporter
MLGQMAGDREVGIYGAAVRFSEVSYFIPVAIVASFAPSLAEVRKLNVALYYRRLSNLFRLLTGIALAISVPMTFAAARLTEVAYGGEYAGAAEILAIHVWATPFVFLGVAMSPWTVNEGMTSFALFRTASGAIANILLNLVLIPAYGAVGAAVATVVSYAMSGVLLNVFNSKARKVFFLQLKSVFLLPRA